MRSLQQSGRREVKVVLDLDDATSIPRLQFSHCRHHGPERRDVPLACVGFERTCLRDGAGVEASSSPLHSVGLDTSSLLAELKSILDKRIVRSRSGFIAICRVVEENGG